jgi:GNAT superfamily N-acetyltransferase
VHELRPMAEEDVAACEGVWHEAFAAMRHAYHLPGPPAAPLERDRLRRRIAGLRATDPDGAWVAARAGEVVGFAQAFRREDLWVLSLLAVDLAHQGEGVARALLERALAYGDPGAPGLIQSSRDPKAMHRYVQAGFALHPALAARGVPRRAGLLPAPGVRPGDEDDLALVERIDRQLRGAPRGPELRWIFDEGDQLLVLPGRGYALARSGGGVRALGALDEEAARLLLSEALAAAPAGAAVDVNWMTAAQQWAIRLCTDLGLELVPVGSVMVRGRPGPLSPYLPSGAYG